MVIYLDHLLKKEKTKKKPGGRSIGNGLLVFFLLFAGVNKPEEEAGYYHTNGQRNVGTEMKHDLEVSGASNGTKGKDGA